ncbi:MAG: T9SS type A sorting domain-containing protein [Flavobacterium sp.]|uniref:T9SS type A sorting domain-containing protein n=1 Tax=Flavobacterium sp. TaxID=239 RepID=UPI0012171B87|nr:T9SS type A sorting domain-containing protein [Flavobacterium sp.]RZJ66568.1 MAG: T9SS type A sorting domain-containing protein [Flavobacterium sp.]
MKQQLLFLFAFLSFSISSFGQVVINQPADITQCDNPVFDLTTTIPEILNGQPSISVSFYLTQADVVSGINAIPNPTAFATLNTFTTIWARADNQTGMFATTSFQLISAVLFDYNVPPAQHDCSATEFGTFNLISLIPQMVTPQQDYDVFFFESEIDAINVNNVNAIVNTGNYTMVAPYFQTIYASILTISGFDCRVVVPIQLVAGNCTGNTISGTVRYNQNGDDCATSTIGMPGIKVSNLNGNDFRVAYTNNDGDYEFSNILAGTNTTSIFAADLSPGITVAGQDSYTFPIVDVSNETANFCLNSVALTDAAIYFFPVGQARPGFQAVYALQIVNEGNQPLTGNASIIFENTKMQFMSTTVPSLTAGGNQMTMSFANLAPQAAIFGYVYFIVATPPTVNAGDLLAFDASVQVVQADENMSNNSVAFSQTVVNSYDPNDITCLEGATISPAQADGYLHYTIRFQNSGTADAINVRVENQLDTNLNWNTFEPIVASHTYFAERIGNTINFRFNNINLPAEQDDEPASHGFITYRIKPISSIEVGDVIPNSASIFFDFNAPIVTDEITTTVQMLSVPTNNLNTLKLYPNPAKGSFSIRCETSGNLDVSIFDVRGSKVLERKSIAHSHETNVDISSLTSGIYIVKMNVNGLSVVRKLVVN